MGIASKLMKSLRDDEWETPPGAPADAVSALRGPFRELFGIDLPDQYAELLQLADGLSFNGVLIYATRDHEFADDQYSGILQANERLLHGEHDIDSSLRFIGEVDDQLLGYDRADSTWKLVDGTDWTPDDEDEDVFSSFDALLKYLRSEHAE